MAKSAKTRSPISDAAVLSKTGKTWPEWFAILDAAGAATMTHQEVVALLRDQHGVGPWWQQTVTVGYEQARGLRQRYETPEGYQVTVTKTYPVPLAELFLAWADTSVRAQWLPDATLTFRKVTPHKSIAATWSDGETRLDVRFSSRGEGRSRVAVEHSKLPTAEEVARLRAYWKAALERLGALLS